MQYIILKIYKINFSKINYILKIKKVHSELRQRVLFYTYLARNWT